MVEKRLHDILSSIAAKTETLWKEVGEYENDLRQLEKSEKPEDRLNPVDPFSMRFAARTAIQQRMIKIIKYENLLHILNMLFEDSYLWEIADLDAIVNAAVDSYVKA